MTDIFLERNFDPPLSVDDVCSMAAESSWCYAAHHVEWRGSLLATGGRLMLCWFRAPDAESARLALRSANADLKSLWIGTVHDGAEPAGANVLVKRTFDEPVALEKIQALGDAGAWCMQAYRVKFARTFFSLDRKRMICLYRAPDAESVRLAQRESGMPLDEVWSFDRIAPDTLPSAPS
jgi:hypothetical protein